jgi:3-oxoacyl-[acyl-carrier-protein] synthase-3
MVLSGKTVAEGTMESSQYNQMQMGAIIQSIGVYHPEEEVYNSFFENYLDTSDRWIKERTGIERRFYAAKNEYASDMCVKAALNLSRDYNRELDDVDCIIAATSTPDQPMPSVASQVQARLKIPRAGTMDLSAACAGFVYGVILAKGLIAAQTHKKILVFGVETLSKVTDFTDRTSCILFGDAAGAVIVEQSEENHLFRSVTGTDGEHGKDLYLACQNAPLNGADVIADKKLHQNGRVVYKWAVQTLSGELKRLAEMNHIQLSEVNFLIPHSANFRLLEALFKELNLPMEKCLDSIRQYGNTSTASIPLAWHRGIHEGKVNLNDTLMIIGFGGGFTYGGIFLRNGIGREAVKNSR